MFDTKTTVELEAELVALASRIAAAQCRFLRLLAEFDAREGWAGPGIRSCTHWLSWRVGLSRRTGREHVRVARALRSLPLVTEAFGTGRLSYAKVRAITRVATPESEPALVDLALSGTAAQVERAVRAARVAGTPPAGRTARRGVAWRWDDEGCLVLRATLPPEDGERLVTALEAQLALSGSALSGSALSGSALSGSAMSGVPRVPEQRVASPEPGSAEPPAAEPSPAERSPTEPSVAEPSVAEPSVVEPSVVEPSVVEPSVVTRLRSGLEHAPGAARDRLAARRADALLELLAPDSGEHEVTVHVEVATGRATLGSGLPLAASTAQRLACDARVRTLLKSRDGNPLYLGRSHRGVTKTQLAALRIRDRHRCQFPGCEHTRFLHAHHIVHWWHGGLTDVDNLVLLCSFHHRLVHDHPYRLKRLRETLRVWRPDGEEVLAQRPRDPVGEVLTPADLLVEAHVDDEAIVPAWFGERLDLDAVLDAILPVATASA